MKPKEKAENLVEMFMNIEPNKLSDYSRIYHPTAKQCAILLVNEILDDDMLGMTEELFEKRINY